jgi:hypothetical protein
VSPQDLPYARVLIHDAGAADTGRLVALARALPAGAPVFASGVENGVAQSLGWRSAPASNSVLGTLAALRSVDGAQDTLLLSAFAVLPPFAFERLARAAHDGFDLLSALGNAERELSPLPEGERAELGAAAGWDAGVYLAAEHRAFECASWSPTLSLWRATALVALNSHGFDDAQELPNSIRSAVVDDLFVADERVALQGPRPAADPRHPKPAGPLARLRARLGARPAPVECWPGVEPRPRRAARVCTAGAAAPSASSATWPPPTRARIHLALRASGDSGRRQYGEALELVLAREPGRVLRRWPLPRAIAHTADGNAGYARWCAKWWSSSPSTP